MTQYANLSYMKQEDFPTVEYGKAAAIRPALREAINSARAMHPSKMEQVVQILQTALDHIHQEIEYEEDAQPDDACTPSDDPLDSLLGPA